MSDDREYDGFASFPQGSLFDMENIDCADCGRPISGGVCGWCTATKAPTLVRHDAMDTSLAAAAKPKSGTKQAIYVLLHDNPDGLTDMEIEDLTGLPHQSASAARRGLVVAGLAEDSGKRRKNSRGNDAAVWRLVSPYRKDVHDRPSNPVPSPDRPHIHVWTWRDAVTSIEDCRECGASRSRADYDSQPWNNGDA